MVDYRYKQMDLNHYRDQIHAQCVKAGWWDEYLPDRKEGRYPTAMALFISELSEAMEGDRKDLPDDHLPQYPMFLVELADALIRLLDSAGAYGVSLTNSCPMYHSEMATRSVPEQIWLTIKLVTSVDEHDYQILIAVDCVLSMHYAYQNMNNGVPPLKKVVDEKMAYNRKRDDHQKENRIRAGGKKY